MTADKVGRVPAGGYTRAVWLITALVLAIVSIRGASVASFTDDESQWIATSSYLEAFLPGQIRSPVWNESPWTLTQPPLARYVIGVGRLAGGYTRTELNGPWDSYVSVAENEARGNMPSPGLLWWSRLPMAFLTLVSMLLLGLLTTRSVGRLAALCFCVLFVINPFLRNTLSRAMSEAPLLACFSLTAWAAWRAMAVRNAPGRAFGWLLLAGIGAGLAGAAKLNGLALAAAMAMLALFTALVASRPSSLLRRFLLGSAAALAVVAAAFLAFVLLNPYLYPAPLARTQRMLDNRLQEMAGQQQRFPEAQINGGKERLDIVSRRVLERLASVRFPGARWFNLLLCAIGLAGVLASTRRWLRGDANAGAAVALSVLFLAMVIPALFTPLDWFRYYFFPVLFGVWLSSIAAAMLMHRVRPVLFR